MDTARIRSEMVLRPESLAQSVRDRIIPPVMRTRCMIAMTAVESVAQASPGAGGAHRRPVEGLVLESIEVRSAGRSRLRPSSRW